MAQIIRKSIGQKKDDEVAHKGKLIQEHLETVNMDAWDYIYQIYVNPK